MHFLRLLCIFFLQFPVQQQGLNIRWVCIHSFTYKQRPRESFHGVTLVCIGLFCGRVYINLIYRIMYLAASDSWQNCDSNA